MASSKPEQPVCFMRSLFEVESYLKFSAERAGLLDDPRYLTLMRLLCEVTDSFKEE